MTQPRWFFHPVVIFTGSILALVASLFLYIYWYIEISSGLDRLMRNFELEPNQVLTAETWMVILILSILVGIILMGFFIIFVYNLKTLRLYQLQNNFINNFTHELKTPVTSLRLYLETFQKHPLDRESQLRYLDYMIQDTVRLNGTINSILNLAKIESKSYEGNFILKDLRASVRKVFEANAHLMGGCRVTLDLPADRSYIHRIDPVLFDMLLTNLLTNAIKYNRSDPPEITITLGTRRGRLLLSVVDNGIGIGPRNLKRIFKKFYQVGNADDMTARGSGIGLYMAQSIARVHGGRLTAQSDGLGQGSRFTLSLPDRYAMPAAKRVHR
jgi:two-component system, OmpR family, phosphate regulon sensor histidine kinase PhoR